MQNCKCKTVMITVATYSAGDLNSAWGIDSTESLHAAELPHARIPCFPALSVTSLFLFPLSVRFFPWCTSLTCLSRLLFLVNDVPHTSHNFFWLSILLQHVLTVQDLHNTINTTERTFVLQYHKHYRKNIYIHQ